MKLLNSLKQKWINQAVVEQFSANQTTVGSLNFDPWGFNSNENPLGISLFSWFYHHYFRVEASGLDNIPRHGRALFIANHSGQLPVDAALLGYLLATNPVVPRAPKAMMERFLPKIPFIGNQLNRVGAVVGDTTNCRKMLEREEAIMVFPEGVRGTGKRFGERYQLQRFGHGFLHMAIDHQAPIIPVGIVGCEETMPSAGNIKPLASLLGIPYYPLALPVVFPAKVRITIGKPMYFTEHPESEAEIQEQVEAVKDAIRALIHQGLASRKGIFS